jgi:Ca2+-transporting ATPase
MNAAGTLDEGERSARLLDQRVASSPLLGAVILTVLLQLTVVYVPFLNGIFWTEPLSAGELAVSVVAASGVFFAVEGEKWLKRRRGRSEGPR